MKQIIIIRSDLRNASNQKVRTGKLVSQGCHACLQASLQAQGSTEFKEWWRDGQTKITLKIDSEDALKELYKKALEAGLYCAMITDSGKTEFGGVPTITCAAIGPGPDEEIDKITSKLELL